MPPLQNINIAVIGTGGVGSVFVSQLAWLAKTLTTTELSLCYIAMIDKALYHQDHSAIDIDTAVTTLEAKGTAPPSIPEIIEYLANAPHRVILVDNTSATSLAEAYPAFLRRGISVITPNKKAFSGSYQLWEDISSSARAGNAVVFHESSVGAGMPIISTAKELVATGDQITRIEGIFSGTMSYLFNTFAPALGSGTSGESWSSIVKKARELGYTEPDPRDDLNGLDVARKLTILGRLAGLRVESPTAFPVQSLIPKELEGTADGQTFLQQLDQFDDQMKSHKVAAEKEGKVVRFVGSIDVESQTLKVGLESFDTMHPMATLKGSDNIISFYTKRYGALPLTIRGAGAGGDVTAMGVTGDLLKAIAQLR
ncbi:Homoserine dehydrogenase [Aspergillus melleus]|uniref:Homoserine dehydrogenase n=1 Tax=Aspergillus melleus TaxID=138277 RepID=UPI001E8EC64B|nr:Homoserine dehydrogenase [Aspergillus melleus]KAH8424575.1 Homoserine dehydrogenase [Aspergillus melleus]